MGMKNKQLNDYVKKIRNEQFGNEFHSIDDLPLTAEQKKCVIEWYAQKIWMLIAKTTDDDGGCKMYDPLKIHDKGECSSYVFDLEDGGRHHKFKNMLHLEEMITNEAIETINKK